MVFAFRKTENQERWSLSFSRLLRPFLQFLGNGLLQWYELLTESDSARNGFHILVSYANKISGKVHNPVVFVDFHERFGPRGWDHYLGL